MTRNEFIANVKVGTLIRTPYGVFKCTSIPIDGFMYDLADVYDSTITFSEIGITDGSVEKYEIVNQL